MNPLTQLETTALADLERTIAKGQQTFVEVGLALTRIRDERLYRADYGSFNEYCEARWGWGKDYSNKLISAANVVRSLPAATATIVATESQARELAKVPESDRAEVVEKAAKSGKVTAKSLRAAMRTTAAAASTPLLSQNKEEAPHIKTADDEFRSAMGLPTTDEAATELAQIQKRLRLIEIHITDADLTGEDLILLSKEIFRMSERINRIGKSRKVAEAA